MIIKPTFQGEHFAHNLTLLDGEWLDEGLSGTGPKAGGPHYVARFATERVTCIDTTAAGGNATLMAAIDG